MDSLSAQERQILDEQAKWFCDRIREMRDTYKKKLLDANGKPKKERKKSIQDGQWIKWRDTWTVDWEKRFPDTDIFISFEIFKTRESQEPEMLSIEECEFHHSLAWWDGGQKTVENGEMLTLFWHGMTHAFSFISNTWPIERAVYSRVVLEQKLSAYLHDKKNLDIFLRGPGEEYDELVFQIENFSPTVFPFKIGALRAYLKKSNNLEEFRKDERTLGRFWEEIPMSYGNVLLVQKAHQAYNNYQVIRKDRIARQKGTSKANSIGTSFPELSKPQDPDLVVIKNKLPGIFWRPIRSDELKTCTLD